MIGHTLICPPARKSDLFQASTESWLPEYLDGQDREPIHPKFHPSLQIDSLRPSFGKNERCLSDLSPIQKKDLSRNLPKDGCRSIWLGVTECLVLINQSVTADRSSLPGFLKKMNGTLSPVPQPEKISFFRTLF